MSDIERRADDLLSEIDLQRYVRMLAHQWPWILVVTLVAMGVSAFVSFVVLPPSYEATALLAITPPKYLMQFSEEFRALAQERIQTQIYETYPELAMSDELLQEVADSVDGAGLTALRKSLSVNATRNPGLIYLRVRDSDPVVAATVANTWADLYIDRLNLLYGDQEGEYEFFERQLSQSLSHLDAAKESLARFRTRDPSQLIQSELDARMQALNDDRATLNLLQTLELDIDQWRQALGRRSGNSLVSVADELTLLFLQLKAFGFLQAGGGTQFQVSLDQLAEGSSVARQVDLLDSLSSLLVGRRTEIEARILALEPEILGLQEDLQVAANEEARLLQEVSIAESLYESLSRKAEEMRIAAESETGVGRLASRAAVPAQPIGPQKLRNTVAGGAVGLVLGLALAVLLEFVVSPDLPARRRKAR